MIFPQSYRTEECPGLCTGMLDMALQQDLDVFFSDLKRSSPGHELVAQERGSVIRSKALTVGWSCSESKPAAQPGNNPVPESAVDVPVPDRKPRRYRRVRPDRDPNRREGNGDGEGRKQRDGGMIVRGPLRNTGSGPSSRSRSDQFSVIRFGKDMKRYFVPPDRIDTEKQKSGRGIVPFSFRPGRTMFSVPR